MENCNKIIGYRIAAVRSVAKESQGDLAAALGVKREMVNYWENGTRPIKAEMIVAIAKKYGVSADYLLGFTAPDVKTPSIETRAICDYTGLNENAVEMLRWYTTTHADRAFNRKAINGILNNTEMYAILKALYSAVKAEAICISSEREIITSETEFRLCDGENGKVILPAHIAKDFFIRYAEDEFHRIVDDIVEECASIGTNEKRDD